MVWPDGKIIKSYTVLLDPVAVDGKPVKREVPISQQTNTSDNLIKSELSDAIFATALEDSTENEVSLEQKQQMIAIADEVVAREPAVTTEPVANDQFEESSQGDNSKNFLLDKIASSLHIFSQQPKKPKLNYEKLLDLKPTASLLHEDSLPLAESLAMIQINSELESLRNKNKEVANNTIETSKAVTPEITNSYLELIKKYGNDLLWACFLVSTTIFLIYRMMQQNPVSTIEESTPESKPLKPAQSTRPAVPQDPDLLMVPEEQYGSEDLFTNSNQNIYSNPILNTISTRNEELELKIALAKQYLEAGDRNSAKDILQDLNTATIKESKYKEQIDSLIKCFA